MLALHDEGGNAAGGGGQHGVQADVDGIAVGYLHEVGAQSGNYARHEEAGELVHDGNAGITHVGGEEVGEKGRFGAEHTRIEYAERNDDGKADHEQIALARAHEPEGGEDGNAAQQAGDAVHTAAAVAVGKAAGNENEGAHDQSGNHDHGESFGARHVHILHEIGDDEHGKHVEEHAVDPAGAHAEGDVAGMFLADLHDGQGLLGLVLTGLFLGLLEVGRFKDVHTDIKSDAHEEHAHEEGEAPAPGEELFVGEAPGKQRHHTGGKAQPRGKAHLRNAGIEGAFLLARVFIGHEHGAAPFAAEAEALAQTHGLQDDGRGNAYLGIGGHKADADGGKAHDEHGEHQHALAAQSVAEVTEDESAEGAGQITDGKGAVRQKGADERIFRGEIQLVEDNARNHAVKEEVVPFDSGPEQAGQYHLADFFFAGRAHTKLL